MTRRAIKSYVIGWEPARRRPLASIQLEDGSHHALKVGTAAELAALAAILRESPVFLYENGLIVSGWEQIKPKRPSKQRGPVRPTAQ
jgi:hypothetical protein